MNLFYNTSRFFIFFCFLFGVALGQVQAQITLPYTESFEENIFGDFTQDTNDDFDWIRHSGSIFLNGTGPNGSADGTYYIYSRGGGVGERVANLLLAPFEIDAAAKTEFSKLINGKFESGHASENKLVMSANDIGLFPIAAKVHRIDFDGVSLSIPPC